METPPTISSPAPKPSSARLWVPTVTAVALGAGIGGWYAHDFSHPQSTTQNSDLQQPEDSLLSPPTPIDPKLLNYQEIATLDTHLASVRSMALLPNGGVAIVGERTLRIWNTPIPVTPTPTQPAYHDIPLAGPPTALAVDAQGNYYLALRDQIQILTPEGQPKGTLNLPTALSADRKSYITCIVVSPQSIYLADAGQRVVLQYDHAGKLLAQFGRPDAATKNPGLIIPSPHLDIALVPSSNDFPTSDPILWISNPGRHQLAAYNASGQIIESWGHAGTSLEAFPGCCNPTDFALLPDGRFVTAEKGPPRIKIYRPDGQLESVVAPPSAFTANAAGIDVAVDPQHPERIWILDPGSNKVRIFDPK